MAAAPPPRGLTNDKTAYVFFRDPAFLSSLQMRGDAIQEDIEVLAVDGREAYHVVMKVGGDVPVTSLSKHVRRATVGFVDEARPCDEQNVSYPGRTEELLVYLSEKKIEAFNRQSADSESYSRCVVLLQPTKSELYSRSRGLLEVNALASRTVAVFGVGSGGGVVSCELARAGVGRLILLDDDRFELHNIVRHVCGLQDVGRKKVTAMKELLEQINPFIDIVPLEMDCKQLEHNDDLRNLVTSADIFVCCTDNIPSRNYINMLSLSSNTTVIYGRCGTRAFKGDVLRVRPFRSPCALCVFSSGVMADADEVSDFRRARAGAPAYVSDADVNKSVQVGLSVDILPVSVMVTKLSLLELSNICEEEGQAQCGISSLNDDVTGSYFLWGNRREEEFASWPKDGFSRFDRVSIFRWYQSSLPRRAACVACNPECSELLKEANQQLADATQRMQNCEISESCDIPEGMVIGIDEDPEEESVSGATEPSTVEE